MDNNNYEKTKMDFTIFNSIEKEMNLLDAEIDGFYYWIYGRFLVSAYLQVFFYNQSPIKKNNLTSKIWLTMKSGLSYFLQIFQIFKHEEILVFNNSGRRYLEGSYYVDPIADDLVLQYESTVTLETSDSKHHKPCITKNLHYVDIYSIRGYLYYYFTKIFRRGYVDGLQSFFVSKLVDPIVSVFSKYGVENYPIDIIANKLTEVYFVRKSLLKSYKQLLDRIQPRVVIEVCHYTTEKMVLNEIAKDRGIPVVELQHGQCGKEHLAYNYPNGVSIKQFPDYFFTFSSFWNNRSSFPIDKHNVIAVGCPYVEKKKNEMQKGNDFEKTILVLTDVVDTELLMEIAKGISQFLGDKYRILVKLHPLDNPDLKKKYESESIRVVTNADMNLYDSFKESFCMVATGVTTAFYEGMAMGLDGYIFYPRAMAEFKDLCDEGYATPFSDVRELIYMILNNTCNSSKKEFWEKDSLVKQKQALDVVLSLK